MECLILTSSERNVLLNKIYPIALIGSLIWFAGELLFGWLFTTTPSLTRNYWLILLILIPTNCILFYISYSAAKKKRNLFGISIFFIFAFTSGLFSVPIILFVGKMNLYLYGIFSAGLGSMIIVFIVSKIMNKYYFNEGYFLLEIILAIIGIILLEALLIYLLKITSLFTITLSVLFLTYITFSFMFGSILLSKEIKEDFWLIWTLKILLLLFAYILAFFIIIVMIIISIAAKEPIGIYGLDFIPTSKKRKKKQEE